MCKEMMGQRSKIEELLKKDLERCLENIRQNGVYDAPTVMVDMDNLFIANREYFERQGFFFDSDTRIENNKVKYYAWLKLGGEGGELGRECWKKIREAREVFMKNQRQKIQNLLKSAQGCHISVDMKELLFENKLFFEERGYYFEPDTRIENGKLMYLARMKKRK